jgi:hypothetical protein
MTAQGPWFITARAVRDYLTITHRDPRDEDAFADGEDELLELVRRAAYVRNQRNGLQLWRVRGSPRLRLLVSTDKRQEGDLPQVVTVLPEHDRAGRHGGS